jgi:hypothetical protein
MMPQKRGRTMTGVILHPFPPGKGHPAGLGNHEDRGLQQMRAATHWDIPQKGLPGLCSEFDNTPPLKYALMGSAFSNRQLSMHDPRHIGNFCSLEFFYAIVQSDSVFTMAAAP